MKTLNPLLAVATFLVSLTALSGLSRDEALLKVGEVLDPSASLAPVVTYMTDRPISNVLIRPMGYAVPEFTLSGPGDRTWFAVIDLEPCQLWDHDVLYVFVNDATGAVRVEPAPTWPEIETAAAIEVLADDIFGWGKLIHIYPVVPKPQTYDPAWSPAGPAADYGDAPDNSDPNFSVFAYPGVPGRFPTLFNTTNGAGQPGVHVVTPGRATLGAGVSVEADANDPLDPDGTFNLVDADRDERFFVVIDRNTTPVQANLLFEINWNGLIPDQDRLFVNVNADLDRSGHWNNGTNGNEWVVQNEAVAVKPAGTSEIRLTSAFDFGTSRPVRIAWIRLALTAELVGSTDIDAGTWLGTGGFSLGEVEDGCFVYDRCPGPRPPSGPGPEFDPPEDRPEDGPGPLIGWNNLPVGYFALVVEGVDTGVDTAADEAAAKMERTLRGSGYDTTRLRGDDRTANEANIRKWLEEVKAKIVCQDKVLIYFIAHGKKETPGGSMRLRHRTKSDDGTLTGAELKALLSIIPSCSGDICDAPAGSCDVTVIIESCYAGQFLSEIEGEGRLAITSSKGDTPSYYGADGTGGEYSDRYAECAGKDTNGDGEATPEEVHDCAAGKLERPQEPQKSSNLCFCFCPWIPWDCLILFDPITELEVVAYPAVWTNFGEPIAVSFDDRFDEVAPPPSELPLVIEQPLPPLIPGIPLYDPVFPPVPPNDWHWVVEFVFGGDFVTRLEVNVVGIQPNDEVRVPLLAADPFVYGQLVLEVFLDEGIYILSDGREVIFQGQWNLYPFDLLNQPGMQELFFPLPAERSIAPPQPQPTAPKIVEVEIRELSLAGPETFVRWTPGIGQNQYDVFSAGTPIKPEFSFIGNTSVPAFSEPVDLSWTRRFFQVEGDAPVPGDTADPNPDESVLIRR